MARAERLAQALAEAQYPAQGTQPYGVSGSILVLNPTDRRVVRAATTESLIPPPVVLRTAPVIRSWPEAIVAEPPVITGVTANPKQFIVHGSNFSPQADVFLKIGTGAGGFFAVTTRYADPTALIGVFVMVDGQTYAVKVDDPFGGESNVWNMVAVLSPESGA